VNKIGQIP